VRRGQTGGRESSYDPTLVVAAEASGSRQEAVAVANAAARSYTRRSLRHRKLVRRRTDTRKGDLGCTPPVAGYLELFERGVEFAAGAFEVCPPQKSRLLLGCAESHRASRQRLFRAGRPRFSGASPCRGGRPRSARRASPLCPSAPSTNSAVRLHAPRSRPSPLRHPRG